MRERGLEVTAQDEIHVARTRAFSPTRSSIAPSWKTRVTVP